MGKHREVGLIIGLAGKKQVGKSTAAGFLVAAGFKSFSFADPMKLFARDLLRGIGLADEIIDYHMIYKESVIFNLNVTMRHLLQTLGTDWGRNMIHPELWVLCASRSIAAACDNGDSVVVEDVRFDDEARYIRSRGGLIVHITRDTGLVDQHASESGVVVDDGDLVIVNSGEMERFRFDVLDSLGVEDLESVYE